MVGKPGTQNGRSDDKYALLAQKQVSDQALALVKRTEGTALAFSDELKLHLIHLDVQPEDFSLLAAACLVGNVPPDLLRYRHNVSAMVSLISRIRDLGYQKGTDYHVVTYKTDQPEFNPDGSPKLNDKGEQVKTKQPTVQVQLTEACYVRNAEIAGKLKGVENFFFAETVDNRDEAQEIFARHGFDLALWCDKTVVARATCKTLHPQVGLLGTQEAYGFYSPMKFEERWDDSQRRYVKTGRVVEDKAEVGRQKDNYYGPSIAKKLAKAAVARQVTRDEFKRSDVSTYANVAALLREGSAVYSEMTHAADEAGVSFDEYLANKEAIDAQVEEGEKILRRTIDANTMEADSKKSDEKKMETASGPDAGAPKDASSAAAPGAPVDLVEAQTEVDAGSRKDKGETDSKLIQVLGDAFMEIRKDCKELADYITEKTALNIGGEQVGAEGLSRLYTSLAEAGGYETRTAVAFGDERATMSEMIVALLTGGEIGMAPTREVTKSIWLDITPSHQGKANSAYKEAAALLIPIAVAAIDEAAGSQ